tara:strand:- start:59 stop:379 length:321 start_codon:yes stop_codon:yes gene_type:complete
MFRAHAPPSLVDGNFKYQVGSTLRSIHTIKDNYYTTLYNIAIFVAIITALAIYIYVQLKNRIPPEELEEKRREYILNRIHTYHTEHLEKAHAAKNTIVPEWNYGVG